MAKETKKSFADTLDELLEKISVGDKERVYRVVANDQTRFTVANSKGNAALAVCEVETLKPSDVKDARIKILESKVKDLQGTKSSF